MKIVLSLAVLVAATALTAVAVAGNPHDEKFAPTAADQRLASRIAFQQTDMPKGWRYKLTRRMPTDDGPVCRTYDPDFSGQTVTGFANAEFTSAASNASSEVGLFRTTADAIADFNLSTNAKWWSCLRSATETGMRKKLPGATISTVVWRVQHQGNVYGLTSVLAITTPRGRVDLVFDVDVMRRGRAIVSIIYAFPRTQPIAEQVVLAQRTLQRLELL